MKNNMKTKKPKFEIGDVLVCLKDGVGYESHSGSWGSWFDTKEDDIFVVLKMNQKYKTNKNAYEEATHFFYDLKRKMTGAFINSELRYFKKYKEKQNDE